MVLKQETGLEVQLGLAAAFSPEHLPLDNGALIVKIPTSVVWPPLLEVLQTGGSVRVEYVVAEHGRSAPEVELYMREERCHNVESGGLLLSRWV